VITLTPPKGDAPFRTFTLGSGRTYRPDFEKNGQVQVSIELDACELESEGWKRTTPTEVRTQDALRHAANEAAVRRRRL
jgi:hypothetical protein